MKRTSLALLITIAFAILFIILLFSQQKGIGISFPSFLLNLPILMLSYLFWSILGLVWFCLDWVLALLRAPGKIKSKIRWSMLATLLICLVVSVFADPIFGSTVKRQENNEIYSYAYTTWQAQYIPVNSVMDAQDRVQMEQLFLSGSVEFREWDKIYNSFDKQKQLNPKLHFADWYSHYKKQWLNW
ncbi:MAG: hypothetical protein JWN30_2312 [Bacilli bacterium]|nr:hypothetical protein [Bacilli bacterium]